MTEPTLRPVSSPAMTGESTDLGAQPLRWAPTGAAPVLWVSPRARFETGRSIRGGSPVCWPWFGPGRTPGLEPMHGFVRTATWRHTGTDTDGDDVTVTHALTSDDVTSPHFPHRYVVEHRARYGSALELSLAVTNTGSDAFDYEEALHAYLVVGDVRRLRIEGLDGATHLDKTTGERRTLVGDLTFAGETDAVVESGGPVVLDDPVLGRRVRVSTSGAANLVVWNPWADKAAEVADIGADAWTGFVCVEGANTFDHAVRLAPGESHTLAYRLDVEDTPTKSG